MNIAIVTDRGHHRLQSLKILKKMPTWAQRVEQWEKSMTFDERISWLHSNHYRDGNGPEKFLFYLDVADRYGDRLTFIFEPDHNEYCETSLAHRNVADLKRAISQKAFAVLCNVFFAERGDQDLEYPFMIQYKEPLFSKLLWFFRSYDGDGGFDNLRPQDSSGLGKDGGQHYVTVANKFAERFVLDAWRILNHREFGWPDSGMDKNVADPYWKEIVVLLRHLGLLKGIESFQNIPTPDIFRKMAGLVLGEDGVKFSQESLSHMETVRQLVEPSVIDGNPLARAVYLLSLRPDCQVAV